MTKKILYIVPHRLNRSPGQRFRCEHFIPILKENGYTITYSNLLSEWDDRYFYKKGHYFIKSLIFIKACYRRIVDILRARKYDGIFIYREAFMIGTILFEQLLKKSGKPIIYDFDDSIWLPDISEGNKNLSWLKRPSKTNDIIKLADLVIVGNSYLAKHASIYCKNTVIIPTTIDTNYHKPTTGSYHKTTCIGWTGSETTIRHFKLIIPVLMKIKEKYGDTVSFIQICNIPYECPEIGLKTITWTSEDEIQQLSLIDIGIMPLPNDEWSQGKCGFKGLQYMAMGIPTIMSPVGVNTEIIENGKNGFFATTDDEWFAIIRNLIENKELRTTIGERGRSTVIERYSITSQMEKYLSLFNDIIQ